MNQCLDLEPSNVEFLLLRSKLQLKLTFYDAGNIGIATAFEIDPDHVEVAALKKKVTRDSQDVYERACACK